MPLSKNVNIFILIALLFVSPWASAGRFTRGRAIHRLYLQRELEKMRQNLKQSKLELQMLHETLRDDWIAERNEARAAIGIPADANDQTLEELLIPLLGTYISYTSDFSSIQSIVRLFIVGSDADKTFVLDRWSDGQIFRVFESRLEDLPNRISDPTNEAKQAIAIAHHGEVFGATLSLWRLLLSLHIIKNEPRLIYEIKENQEVYMMELGLKMRTNRDTQKKLRALDEKEFERGGVQATQFINARYENPTLLNLCVAELTPDRSKLRQ